MAKMTKKEKKEKIDAVKALDTQIVQSQKAVAEMLTTKGADSPEYKAAVDNLKALAESRAVIAETIPKRCKVDPTAFVTGAFGLASTFLLLVYDDEHTVPKWFHNGLDMAKSFLRK